MRDVNIALRRALGSASILWISSLGAAVLAFVIQVILARSLSPGNYGLFVSALTTIGLLSPIPGFGIAQYWLKAFGAEGRRAQRWVPVSLQFGALTTVISVLLLLCWAFLGPHDWQMQRLLLVLLPVNASSLLIALVGAKLQLEEEFSRLAMWQLFPNTMRFLFVLGVSAAAVRIAPNRLAVAYASIAVILTIVGVVQIRSMLRGELKLKGSYVAGEDDDAAKPGMAMRAKMLELARGAWPFGLGTVFHLIYFQSDVLLLKYLKGNEVAGIYSVAFTIMIAVYLLPSSVFQKFLMPKVHRWAVHDRKKLLRVYRFGNGIMLAVGGCVGILLLILAPWGVPLLFGVGYRKAVPLVLILAISAPMRYLASSVGATLVTRSNMRRKSLYMGGVAVFNVLLNIALIPALGARGAAIATVASETLLLGFYLVAARVHVFGRDAWHGWTLKY